MLTLKQILSNYFSTHQALPAFNIDSFEIYQAVEDAVAQTRLPCLVELSPGEDKFIDYRRLYLLVQKSRLEDLPIYLNLDHGADPARLLAASRLGFDMVHFDGSRLSLSENLTQSTSLSQQVHPTTLLEVEFDEIGSPDFTSPKTAADFVAQSSADLLAVSIGNRHGNTPGIAENINLDLLSQIHHALPETFLTLHGGSGIPLPQVKKAISLGVVKININTDLRQTFLQSLRQQLNAQNTEKIYEYFTPVIAQLRQLIVSKLLAFASL